MRLRSRTTLGVLLIIGGGLALLQSLGILKGDTENVILTLILGSFALVFLTLYTSNRKSWWWLIPGITLLALTIINILDFVIPNGAGDLEDLILFSGIGFSFWLIYFTDRAKWWAIIPGGVLIAIAVSENASALLINNIDTEALFFLGVGITFLLLFILPTPYGRIRWAIYPALGLLLFGGYLGFDGNQEITKIFGPAVIILAGIYFLIGAVRKKTPEPTV